jgi:hypothetical protein
MTGSLDWSVLGISKEYVLHALAEGRKYLVSETLYSLVFLRMPNDG